MKNILLSSVALIGIAGTAVAADLPERVPVKAPPIMARAFSWTGCYIGVNDGWIGSRYRFDLAPTGTYRNPAGVAPPPNAAGTGALAGDLTAVTSAYRLDESGLEVGGQVGCNYQTGVFVFGVEGDGQWAILGDNDDNTVRVAYPPLVSANPAFVIARRVETVDSQLNWFSTFRARAGVAFDRVFVYGTGGLAVGDLNSSTSVAFGGNVGNVYGTAQHFGSFSDMRIGWTAGGGLEWAFANHWTAKVEYLYLNLGNTISYLSALVAPAGRAPGYAWTTSVDSSYHVARIGLNYKF